VGFQSVTAKRKFPKMLYVSATIIGMANQRAYRFSEKRYRHTR